MKEFIQKYKAMIAVIITALVMIVASMLGISVKQDDVSKAVNGGISIIAPDNATTTVTTVPTEPPKPQ